MKSFSEVKYQFLQSTMYALLLSITNIFQYRLVFHMNSIGNKQDEMVMRLCLVSLIFCVVAFVCSVIGFFLSLLQETSKRISRVRFVLMLLNVINAFYGIVFLGVIKKWEQL